MQHPLRPRAAGQMVQEEGDAVRSGVDADQQHVKENGQRVLGQNAVGQQQGVAEGKFGVEHELLLVDAQAVLGLVDVVADD